jgi:hypothetical protein
MRRTRFSDVRRRPSQKNLWIRSVRFFVLYANNWVEGTLKCCWPRDALAWRQFLTTLVGPQGRGEVCPLGANLAPRCELCYLGVLFTPSFTPRGEHSLMFRRTKGQTEGLHPWGITSLLGDKFHPWGPTMIHVYDNFLKAVFGKTVVCLLALWYILRPLGIFFPFWYVVRRKIWQPWPRGKGYKRTKTARMIKSS